MASKTLRTLVGAATRTAHDKRASIQTFADLDVARLAAELELEKRGARRGEENQPPSSAQSLDEVETQVVERVKAEQKKSHQFVEDELGSYTERLANLEFEQHVSTIRQAVPACVGEFRGEVTQGLDELHGPRDNFRRAHDERNSFQHDNRLHRAARTSSAAGQFLKGALIVLILIVESVLNGVFLATGSAQGLLGGVSTAIGFAFLNIGIALLFGRFGVPELNHRRWSRKLVGLVSLALYLGLATLLNLGLAHYRDAATGFVTDGGRLVMERLQSSPWQLDDLMSWILFGIGLGFSIIAFIDAYLWTDPYPQYGAVQKRLEQRRLEYTSLKKKLIEELDDVRQDYVDQINEISNDLSKRRREFDMIISHRARLVSLFDQHQAQLSTVAGTLTHIYRRANERKRTIPAPEYFAQAIEIPAVSVRFDNDREIKSTELDGWIRETTDLLGHEVAAIHKEYETAFEQYQRLDDLVGPVTVN